MKNKKIQVWLPLLFSITMIAGMFFGYKMRDNMPGKKFFFTEKRKPVQEIIDLVQNKYVSNVEMDTITLNTIQSLLRQLDPHSIYIPAKEVQQINDDLAGNFSGIGIEFNIFNDTLNVINVIPDGPGFKAGLQTGDQFIAVEDKNVAGNKTASETFRYLLRGKQATDVKITYLRNGQKNTVTLTRDMIPVSSIDAGYMIADKIGYIRINRFSNQTYREFMQTLEALKKKGMQKLILDLRDNGGGILDAAVEIADEFIDADKLITYTEGAHVEKKEYRCRRPGQFETGELVVLADEGSASASEVLMGALQDWDRATIIGRRTFGKGLVQEQFELSDRSALRLTVAKYFTPMGRSIQRSYANGGKAYYDEIRNRFEDGEIIYADSIKNDTSKVYKTSKGKTVFGGGGITPDIFVAMDTSLTGNKMYSLYNKSTISYFAYKYFLQHKAALKKYPSTDNFNADFSFSELDWSEFVKTAIADSISLVNFTAKLKSDLLKQLKSSVARLMWRAEGYFKVTNATDETVAKALEKLKKP